MVPILSQEVGLSLVKGEAVNPMNLVTDSPDSLAGPGDDLDRLLRAYFRAERPEPWPACPAAPVRPSSRRLPGKRSFFRSRLALAASVALLVAGSLLLAGAFPSGPETPASPSSQGTATREKLWLDQPAKGPTVIRVEIEEASDK